MSYGDMHGTQNSTLIQSKRNDYFFLIRLWPTGTSLSVPHMIKTYSFKEAVIKRKPWPPDRAHLHALRDMITAFDRLSINMRCDNKQKARALGVYSCMGFISQMAR